VRHGAREGRWGEEGTMRRCGGWEEARRLQLGEEGLPRPHVHVREGVSGATAVHWA